MREVSEKRFDDPEKKLNHNVDNRSGEERRADNVRQFHDIFGGATESSQEVQRGNDFKNSIKVDDVKETELQEGEITTEISVLEVQYQEEQRGFDEQLAKLLEQKELLGKNPDKELLEKIKSKARQVIKDKDLSTIKYNGAKQKLNPRYREYSKEELPRVLKEKIIELNEADIEKPKEISEDKGEDSPTFKTTIDGNNVEYRKEGSGDEIWYINGEETASKKTIQGDITKKETTQGYREVNVTKNGIDFPTKVRATELDTIFEETTLLYAGEKNGVITKADVPLTDLNGELVGRQVQTQIVRENQGFQSTNIISTFADTQDIVEQSTILDRDKTTFTNSINGNPVFKMEKTPLGTIITQYNEQGEAIWGFKYDKDGNPTNPKNIYPGLETIPDKINYDVDIDLDEHDKFWDTIHHGGIPQDLNDRLDNSYPEMHTRNPIIKQAKIARDKTNNAIEDRTSQGFEVAE